MENMKPMPRVLIAGANSGCGKTSITCGILKALVNRELHIQSYKCGPDYIDPMLHSHITGRNCRNLDPFFSTGEDLRYLVGKDSQDVDFSVTEGVMGYYDGVGISCEKSTWTVSKETGTPTILIFNVKGMSHTMIPLIKGMVEYQDNPVAGVILNRCSKGMYQLMKPEIEEKLGISVVGYFPQKEGIYIGSRHLGLMTAAEIDNLDEILSLLGETAEECIDLDLLLEIGEKAEPLTAVKRPEVPAEKRAKIAVAWDKAFCFYYKENLEILEQLGAELCYFSPVNDVQLPEGSDGIYLGGGYPETYRKELAENLSMKESICEAAKAGKPIIAECGGFMYLHDTLAIDDKHTYPMVGVIPGKAFPTAKLQRFGYVRLYAKENNLLCNKNEELLAHEFHYWDSENCGSGFKAVKESSGKQWDCVHAKENMYAGFPHLYFYANLSAALRFVEACHKYGGNNDI